MMPHTEVEFELRDGEVVLRPSKTPRHESRGHRLVEQLRGRATTRLTTDEILALTRPAT